MQTACVGVGRLSHGIDVISTTYALKQTPNKVNKTLANDHKKSSCQGIPHSSTCFA